MQLHISIALQTPRVFSQREISGDVCHTGFNSARRRDLQETRSRQTRSVLPARPHARVLPTFSTLQLLSTPALPQALPTRTHRHLLGTATLSCGTWRIPGRLTDRRKLQVLTISMPLFLFLFFFLILKSKLFSLPDQPVKLFEMCQCKKKVKRASWC